MCGITAFSGRKEALPFLLQGLEKLEYRGYDSAGITTVESFGLFTKKAKGRLQNLKYLLSEEEVKGHVGIGHTRWATHGIPSNLNSHPHTNNDNTISLVHNGIIENYRELKEELLKKGYQFHSETDSEVVVHLLDLYYKQTNDLFTALKKVINKIDGSYALCIVSTIDPDKVYITKKDSPLVIGKTQDASVAASDIPAILDYTKDVYFLNDYEIAILDKENISFFNQEGNPIEKEMTTIPYDNEAAQKAGFSTFMLKEIFEQPHAIQETLRGRVEGLDRIVLPELDDMKDQFQNFNKAYFIACGTAYHACLVGSHILERLTGIPTFTQAASEFRYCDPIVDEKTLCIFVSQSGETADTLAALRLAKEKQCATIAVANVLGSTISREAAHTIYTCAGPEIAVASTKAYTTQLIVLILLAMYVSQSLGHQSDEYKKLIEGIASLPQYIENILKDTQTFENYATYLKDQHDAYFIGRGLDYASVLEGALKLKEVSYVHADAYMAGELKHGPIALIEEGSIIIAAATQPTIAAKTISNIQETIARGAKVILFTTQGQELKNVCETYILPDVHPILQAIIVAIPLQLIAYYTANLKGCDVDKPRNLAKSVTVE
ncbi:MULTISPECIES: glutamine--fructose-6-phosphate transaminase (isomerizing) [Coprobacillaceae]|uniref:glutamine--fructose-6-phosphate transaminase (isomerizing) n=1 Tax=Coprobacillaceae TaxID=2810280 RepID=UPI000E5426F4|nr:MULTISPECIES: glutamine--fructose-6-phosphate transaminase (isomerizing) [Coprobacillaceae]RHM61729.1 glutamine--fructose-6-phosphate transaminase (isomerizing) [Coprobacillus sp. AF33-1AC]RHS91707.1 glutamine--fructose-6-phosphate transaminase (isomerizing) [Erysipelatoclostridium sp. AM42-17]